MPRKICTDAKHFSCDECNIINVQCSIVGHVFRCFHKWATWVCKLILEDFHTLWPSMRIRNFSIQTKDTSVHNVSKNVCNLDVIIKYSALFRIFCCHLCARLTSLRLIIACVSLLERSLTQAKCHYYSVKCLNHYAFGLCWNRQLWQDFQFHFGYFCNERYSNERTKCTSCITSTQLSLSLSLSHSTINIYRVMASSQTLLME